MTVACVNRRVLAATGLALVSALAGLAGCSADKPKPAPLQPIESPIAGRQVWSTRLGGVTFPLSVVVRGGRFHLASDDGTVLALDAATGQEAWRGNVGGRISAGVGTDGRYAAVVTRDNELVVLDAGTVTWRLKLESPVVTAPLVAGERVFIVGVDRIVHAFDVLDGRRLWTLKRPGDALTLSQAGVLATYKDTLLVGQGARLLGVDPLKGTVRWDTALTTPRGTNEVERLADLVGPAVRQGDLICARAFQSSVGCVNAERGSALWNRVVGGTNGIGADDQVVVAGDASDRLSAWKLANGDLAWSADQFQHRKLSAPVVTGKQIVIGDYEGQVHLLDRDTGKTRSRLPTDGSQVVTIALLGDTALVATKSGGLFAIKAE